MKRTLLLLGLSLATAFNILTPTAAAEDLPNCRNLALTTNKTVTAPESDVPSHIALFSGAWEGKWKQGFQTIDSAIVFNKVTPTSVTASYVFNGVQQGTSDTYQVAEDGSLVAEFPLQAGLTLTFTWRLSDDGATLHGGRALTNIAARPVPAEFSRCAP